MSDQLSDEQVENWRHALMLGPIGPFAMFITRDGIQAIHDRFEQRITSIEDRAAAISAALESDGKLIYHRQFRQWFVRNHDGSQEFELTPKEATAILQTGIMVKVHAGDVCNIFRVKQTEGGAA